MPDKSCSLCAIFLIFSFLLPSIGMAGDTCFTDKCHSDFQQGEIRTHPDDGSCTDCHQGDLDTHGGEEGGKLTLAAKICGECHTELVDGHQYPHSPVAKGECGQCHHPHGDMENMLLKKVNSRPFYVAYSEEQYKLCFSCHPRDLLMYPETGFSTDFRDGIKNLHYLHVTKGVRGRNCIVCHDVHGSGQPKLMVESVDFGVWQMKMGFIKTETGGRCATGCHRVKDYDRKVK